MNTKTLSSRALSVVDQYIHFHFDSVISSVPYFNNRTVQARAALRTYVGKGSPKDIAEEMETLTAKFRIDRRTLTPESIKKLLADNTIGIDCSGFAYYVLAAENAERGHGALEKHISFVQAHGLRGKILSSLRPVNHIGVATFVHNKNSTAVTLSDIQPGDMITMLSEDDSNADKIRNHILIIHQVEYQNFKAYKVHYSHAIAYPEDGLYGSGVRQGTIEITDPAKSITEQRWVEDSKEGSTNTLFVRAANSKTEVRRLRWWK